MTDNAAMDWDSPADRLALIEAVGIEEYNRRLRQWLDDSTLEVVAGRSIRPARTGWGTLYVVAGTGSAFLDIEDARRYARAHPAPVESEAG